jgi:ATP-grasp domain
VPRPPMPDTRRHVVYLGLRRSPLEWAAEIAAAADRGLGPYVLAEGSLAHTGLPPELCGRLPADPARLAGAAVGVTCWGDRYVAAAAELADRLGLRGPGAAAARVCTDKVAQRRALAPTGLNPAWRAGAAAADLRAAAAELGPGALFKLAHSSGGRGTTVLAADTDLDTVLKQTEHNYLDSTAFLVEELVEGSEHSVAGLVSDGTVRVLGIADKVVDGTTLRTSGTVLTSERDPAGTELLTRAAEAAVRAVGLRTGGFHVDARLSGGRAVVLEVGARLGGDLINSHLLPIASGGAVLPYPALLDVVTTGALPAAADWTGTAAMLVLGTGGQRPADAVAAAGRHPLVRAAADWSSDEPAVAVVLGGLAAADVDAAAADLRDWLAR